MATNMRPANQVSTAQVAPDATEGGTLLAAARPQRYSLVLANRGSVGVYIGNTGLTTSTGLLLNANDVITIDTEAAVYGITAADTGAIHVMEVFD